MHAVPRPPVRRFLIAVWTVAVVALLSVGATGALAFSTTVVTSEPMSEPGIAVAADGTIYIDGPEGLLSNLPGSPSPVFRSGNGGVSWTKTPFSLRENLPGGGDSNIALDPSTGAIYMTDLWLGNSTVSSAIGFTRPFRNPTVHPNPASLFGGACTFAAGHSMH